MKFTNPYFDSEQLQNIVESINHDEKVLLCHDGEFFIEPSSCSQFYVCPANFCRHHKMNVWKIVEKLQSIGFQGTSCINGCRNNCICKETDLSITATVGGISIVSHKLSPIMLEKLITSFDEERMRCCNNV